MWNGLLSHYCNSKSSFFLHPVAVQSESQVVAVDNLWLCIAITLDMGLVISLAQPFAQPQMNVLQSVCFACAWPLMGSSLVISGFRPEVLF